MTRPVWELMSMLPMYSDCQRDSQKNVVKLKNRIINIPSGSKMMNRKLKLGYFADGPWSHNAFMKIVNDSRFDISLLFLEQKQKIKLFKLFKTI